MSKQQSLYVAKVVSSTSADGVGLRNSLYVSGCPLRCEGCHNSQLWELAAGTKRSVNDVFAELNQDDFNISILGGEPLMQYPAILELCKLIKKRTKKTIWLWTGYDIAHVEIFFGELLKYIDVIVDGPFQKENYIPNLKWRGSSNQKIWEIQHGLRNSVISINEICK